MESFENGEPGSSGDATTTRRSGRDCKRNKFSDLLHFLYNSETKEVCGRSGMSWLKVSSFYVVLYAALCGFFAVCLATFLALCIDDSRPKLVGYDSLLQLNPALGFRPQPDVEATLIKLSRNGSNEAYLADLRDFLKPYHHSEQQKTLLDCETLQVTANRTAACFFNMSRIHPSCSEQNKFGITEGKPCVLVKMNRIYGWLPANKENSSELEDIGLSCSGVNEADNENIGTLEYYPNNYFHHRYYPYLQQNGYLSPFIMLRFMNMTKHTIIMVSCRLKASSIRYDPVYQEGGVRFEILVD